MGLLRLVGRFSAGLRHTLVPPHTPYHRTQYKSTGYDGSMGERNKASMSSELDGIVDEVLASGLKVKAPVRKDSFGELVIKAKEIRPLTAADMLRAQESEVNMGTTATRNLKALRTRHHKVAQMKATGEFTNHEIAMATGYGVGRVDTLLQDPSMLELVAFYQRAEIEGMIEAKAEMKLKYENIVDTGTDILQERLEEAPEEFTSMQILDVIERLGDRCGIGPKATVEGKFALGLMVGDSALEAIKEKAAHEAKGRVLSGPSTAPSSERTETGGASIGTDKHSELSKDTNNQPSETGFDIPEESSQMGGTGFREEGKKAGR